MKGLPRVLTRSPENGRCFHSDSVIFFQIEECFGEFLVPDLWGLFSNEISIIIELKAAPYFGELREMWIAFSCLTQCSILVGTTMAAFSRPWMLPWCSLHSQNAISMLAHAEQSLSYKIKMILGECAEDWSLYWVFWLMVPNSDVTRLRRWKWYSSCGVL